MSRNTLNARTRKELAAMARERRVAGWHAMRKAQLIEALAALGTARRRRQSGAGGTRRPRRGADVRPHALQRRSSRRLAPAALDIPDGLPPDSLLVSACDSHWLLARWSFRRQMLHRARAALALDWHEARPVIRVYDVTSDDARTGPRVRVRDVEVHGETDHWYIPVERPPRSYRLEIGYLTAAGRFFLLAASQTVTSPRPGWNGSDSGALTRMIGAAPASDGVLARDPGSMRPGVTASRGTAGSRANGAKQAGTATAANRAGFPLRLDCELVIYGTVPPGVELTCLGEPVPVREDGTFSLRSTLPNGREVIPLSAALPNGEVRPIVLSVERNTRELEPPPVEHPSDDEW